MPGHARRQRRRGCRHVQSVWYECAALRRSECPGPYNGRGTQQEMTTCTPRRPSVSAERTVGDVTRGSSGRGASGTTSSRPSLLTTSGLARSAARRACGRCPNSNRLVAPICRADTAPVGGVAIASRGNFNYVTAHATSTATRGGAGAIPSARIVKRCSQFARLPRDLEAAIGGAVGDVQPDLRVGPGRDGWQRQELGSLTPVESHHSGAPSRNR